MCIDGWTSFDEMFLDYLYVCMIAFPPKNTPPLNSFYAANRYRISAFSHEVHNCVPLRHGS